MVGPNTSRIILIYLIHSRASMGVKFHVLDPGLEINQIS